MNHFENYEDLKGTLKQEKSLTFLFETEDELPNNTATMVEFLEMFDIPEEDINIFDGTYVELLIDNELYRVDAGGNGDFRSHKIDIEKL